MYGVLSLVDAQIVPFPNEQNTYVFNILAEYMLQIYNTYMISDYRQIS